jgi:hypothetical protein
MVLLAAGTAASAAAPDFKEGDWGTNYRMEVIGMPIPMPPISVKKSACLTKSNYIPDNSQPGQDCQVSDQKVSGNTVSWTMRCKAKEGTIEGKGKITYKGEHYDGVMDTKLSSPDNSRPPIQYRYTMEGERLGACAK